MRFEFLKKDAGGNTDKWKFMGIRSKYETSTSVILNSIIWWEVAFRRLGKGF